jgi:hypothetical protein
MARKIYQNLQDLTGHESGAVLFEESGEILICNWSQVQGIPRVFVTGIIGLGEPLTAVPCAVPKEVKRAMNDHEREQGAEVSKNGFRAWRVNGKVIVVTQANWH